jgi:hypothetical protein
MGHKTTPRHTIQPHPGKVPRTEEDPRAYKREKVRWSFQSFDSEKKWYDDQYTAKTFNDIAEHLKSYERRTWGEIEANRERDHPVAITHIIPEAKARLESLRWRNPQQLDDNDYLMRFEFTGMQRIWGFRSGYYFMVLWWDPQHKICPSQKKHT